MKALNKTHKSHSNPSKLTFYMPAYNGPKLLKKQQGNLSARSLQSHKKFGIRQMNVSPLSHANTQKKKSQMNLTKVNTINLNQLYQDQKLKIFNSPKMNSATNKMQKLNYFKSANINKIVNKMSNNSVTLKTSTHNKMHPFKFQPIKKLAKGQYGSIYLAVSEQTNFVVVLKCFDKTKVAVQFLIDQLKIQLYCKHPNILPAYGFFFGKSEIYLILEAGTHNLYSQIKKQGFLSQKKTVCYIHQIMKGLSYLHLNGVIHRDLKPQNVIICGDTLKISDFGWSIITETERTTFCGTMQYVSPEVSLGKPYDLKIDSWSVGILAYEMLTGFPPFEINNYSQRNGHPKLNYKKQVKFPCTLSEAAKNFIVKMLRFDPKKRPSIAEALRDDWITAYSNEFTEHRKQQMTNLHQIISRKY